MKRARRGFSMLEVLVVVAIVAIFSALAFPKISESIQRSRFNGAVRAHPSRCLAFQRTVNPVPNGYRRVVFGIGCSLRDLGQVYDALKQLDAPGD